MTEDDRKRWDTKYTTRIPPEASDSADAGDRWLLECLERIPAGDSSFPPTPKALDLACGLGHNAIALAQRGWEVDAVDVSPVGLEIARQFPGGDRVNWICGDLDDWTPSATMYDLVTVFRFLDRRSVPRVVREATRPGGYLVYETFARAQLQRLDNHIRNPDFTLTSHELSGEWFPDWETIVEDEVVLEDRTVVRYLARLPEEKRL